MNLSIILILFILIIQDSDNARIKRRKGLSNDKRNKVAYCELKKPKNMIKERRDCCRKIINVIVDKRYTKRERRYFETHPYTKTTRGHILRVASYFKTNSDLPKMCRNLKYPEIKIQSKKSKKQLKQNSGLRKRKSPKQFKLERPGRLKNKQRNHIRKHPKQKRKNRARNLQRSRRKGNNRRRNNRAKNLQRSRKIKKRNKG
ncbi:hypothetical protein ACQ4LE_009857 [Meloidogyne hapla]|uniref:Uncharacterized protein n=1 Tax=Meloidogyne hapla TaxID=6305 RepID=A0A1I8B4Z3_MELHA